MQQVFYIKVTTNLPAIHISALHLIYICCACTTYHLYLIWICSCQHIFTIQYTLISLSQLYICYIHTAFLSHATLASYSLAPRHHHPVFDSLQYVKKDGGGKPGPILPCEWHQCLLTVGGVPDRKNKFLRHGLCFESEAVCESWHACNRQCPKHIMCINCIEHLGLRLGSCPTLFTGSNSRSSFRSF